MADPRYKVENRSVLGHGCCFEATVVDTANLGNRSSGVVCECVDDLVADEICELLNARDARKAEGRKEG